MRLLRYCSNYVVITVANLIVSTTAFVPSFQSSSKQHLVLLQESGRVEWDPALNGNAPASSFATESAGEATMRLGLNSAPTVWTEFGRLGQEHDVVNLGQGFPDWLPPEFAVESLVEAAQDQMHSPHQYTRPAGHPNLVNQLAKRYSVHMGREIQPMTEVAVTVGASQALYLSLQTLIQPGTAKEPVMFSVVTITIESPQGFSP